VDRIVSMYSLCVYIERLCVCVSVCYIVYCIMQCKGVFVGG